MRYERAKYLLISFLWLIYKEGFGRCCFQSMISVVVDFLITLPIALSFLIPPSQSQTPTAQNTYKRHRYSTHHPPTSASNSIHSLFQPKSSPTMPHDPSLLNQTVPYGIYPNCTLKVDCNLDYYSNIDYYPSLGGNTFYLALFAILLITQVVQGVLWKTWSYTIAMLFGLVLECVGYGGRVAMSQNPFEFNYFLVYVFPPIYFTNS